MNISGFDDCLCVSPEVIFGQTDLLDDAPKLDEDSSLDDSQKEISDAILEVLEEETSLEGRVGERVDFSAEDRIMYEALGEEKGLDYSKLEYGKIAEPLAIQWDYSQYNPDDNPNDKKKGIRFVSEETISVDDVNKVIEEKVYADKLKIVTTLVDPTTRDMFKYYRLFNHALVKVKYDMAFS
ncbi:hypothetical protein CEE44_05110 [Candidatus Woesearchaeota archaeon B3_Woes]|nr:MAG: hypothetical protein CEE44_05110 [Candidatus Woesearchaeota archaeon B3_Woes]